jgi:hypothetical protein
MTRGESGKADPREKTLDRRAALARLGLAATVAYSAPVVLRLDREANAVILPTPCRPPRGGGPGSGPPGCR